MQSYSQNEIKKKLGKAAADYVQEGMIVGLGTGSTATCFIDNLILRCQSGLKIQAVCSSLRSKEQAEKGGIPLLDMSKISQVDLTIDGADEVDNELRLIKGGGGAHLYEKILATASKELIILVDESKLVSTLGEGKLPVEIIPFGITSTLRQITTLGYEGQLRKDPKGDLYITESKNYLFDIYQPNGFTHPEKSHLELIQIPGIIETGFFFNLAHIVLVGYQDGHIKKLIRR